MKKTAGFAARSLSLFAAISLAGGCMLPGDDGEDDEAIGSATDELTGFSVRFITPVDGGTVRGQLGEANRTCIAEVTSRSTISSVDFYLDGTLLNTERYAPYACGWDTTNTADGSKHTLRAVARDSRGRTASTSINVTVNNGTTTTPPPPPPPTQQPPPPSGPTLYVATNGNDSNAGTSSAPLRTIARAVALAKAGHTIIVRPGTYGPTGGSGSMAVTINKAGTASAPITLRSETKWGAKLDCQLECHSYINFGASGAYWVIEGFDITGGRSGGIWANSGGTHHITVRGNRIHHIGNRTDSSNIGIVGLYSDEESAYFTIDGNVFHDVGRTNKASNSFDHGVYSHGSNFTIINNVFYNMTSGWGIQTASSFNNALIANNTFAYPAAPAYGKAGQLILWDRNWNITIRNNVFYNPSRAGIEHSETSLSGCVIENNLVYSTSGSVSMLTSLPSGCTQSNNRVNINPMFVDPNSAPLGFRLRAGSPAVDTGMAIPAVRTDFDGVARPQGPRLDVGAFELMVN